MRRRSPSEEQACNTQCAARQNSAPCQGVASAGADGRLQVTGAVLMRQPRL